MKLRFPGNPGAANATSKLGTGLAIFPRLVSFKGRRVTKLHDAPKLSHCRPMSLLGVVTLVVTLACSSGGTNPATTIKGGTLNWATYSDATGYDVQVNGSAVSWQYLSLVYEGLVELKDGITVGPKLAQSWERTSPTIYIFHLRTDAKFSNGRLLDADDVVTSFKRVLDPKNASTQRNFLGPIKTVTAVDSHTVRFELETTYDPFVDSLAMMRAAIIPGKEFLDGSFDPTKQMLGTGPFMLKEHLPGQSLTFVRNPYYWRAGYPKVDQVVAKIYTDTSARLAALRNGTVDIANFSNTDAPSQLQTVPNAKVVQQNTADYWNVDLNAVSPTSRVLNIKVRQAINMAIDRNQIISLALGGVGTRVAPGPGSADSCDVSTLPSSAHDLARARQLLSEAGATNLTMGLIALADYPQTVAIAQVIQQNLKAIGITVNVEVLPLGEASKRMLSGGFDGLMSFEATYTNPMFGLSYYEGKLPFTRNFAAIDPQLQSLIGQARQMGPGPARKALFQQICTLVDQNSNDLPLASRVEVIASRSDKVQAKIPNREMADIPLRFIAEFALVSPH